jgi:hypothetical protein
MSNEPPRAAPTNRTSVELKETQTLKRIRGRLMHVPHPQAQRAAGELKQLIAKQEKK